MQAKRLAILLICVAVCIGQTVLTNETILKMAKAGLGDDVIIGSVKAQQGNYSTAPDDLIALKGAGVSDKVIAAMLERMAAPAAPAAAAATGPAAAGPVNEVGAYYKKTGTWTDKPPEVVNFKTGGVLKTIGSAGIVKGDVNVLIY